MYVTLANVGYPVWALVFLLPKTFKLFGFPIFKLTWWRLFKKHIVHI